jgi:hypothetical protein
MAPPTKIQYLKIYDFSRSFKKETPLIKKKTKNARSCYNATFKLPNKNTCPNL